MTQQWITEKVLSEDKDESLYVALENLETEPDHRRPRDYNGIEVRHRVAVYDNSDGSLIFSIDNAPPSMVRNLDPLAWSYLAQAAQKVFDVEITRAHNRGYLNGQEQTRQDLQRMFGVDRIVNAINSIGTEKKDW